MPAVAPIQTLTGRRTDATALVLRDQLLDRRTRSASLDQSGLLIEPPQRTKFFFPPQFRSMNGGLQHAYCLVVNPQRHWKGMSVFASMRERESRRVSEAVWGSMNDLC